jgi:hypothetical protein
MNVVPQTPLPDTQPSSDLIINKQQNAIKKQIQQAIKLGDLSLVKRIFRLFKVSPNEEITNTAKTCTALHYACSLDTVIILDYLLQLTYNLYKEDYANIINAKTSEGWSLVMITAAYGASNSLALLLKYGGVRLYEKDNNGLRATDLALKYKKESVYKILTKQADHFPMKTITEPTEFVTPLNYEVLTKSEALLVECTSKVENIKKIEDQEEHQELFLNGKRLPCTVCSGDKGWLKYSECCGHPMHPLCVKGIKRCPQCSDSCLMLTTNLKCPEKAFAIIKPGQSANQ